MGRTRARRTRRPPKRKRLLQLLCHRRRRSVVGVLEPVPELVLVLVERFWTSSTTTRPKRQSPTGGQRKHLPTRLPSSHLEPSRRLWKRRKTPTGPALSKRK